jgi:hypothetical protein
MIRFPFRTLAVLGAGAVASIVALPIAPANAAANAWISSFCAKGAIYEKATNTASTPAALLWVNRDGVHIAQLNTRTNGFRGETVPDGTHTYTITNYAGTVTIDGPITMTGGLC